MKISVFYNVKEAYDAQFADEVKEVDLNGLVQIMIKYAWSPSQFGFAEILEGKYKGKKGLHRLIANFLSTDIFAIDIDEKCTINQAMLIAKGTGLSYILGTTRHHQIEKKKGEKILPPCDRFRIVFKLDRPITTQEEYLKMFFQLKSIFPFIDDSCKDSARFFFPCKEILHIQPGNNLILEDSKSLQIYPLDIENKNLNNFSSDALSTRTNRFILNGAPDGQWHKYLFPALCDMKDKGYSIENATILCKKAALSCDGDLDEEDYRQIKDVYENREIKFSQKGEAYKDDKILNPLEFQNKVNQNVSKVVQMSTVQEKPIDFLWSPYIPKGFVTMFTGDPGTGKSTIMSHILSRVSRGDEFWDGQQSTAVNVVIFTAEEPLEEVLKPRLIKTGADTERVFAYTWPLIFDDEGKATIREAIIKFKPGLLIIDPIVSFLGAKIDTSKANEVREKMRFLSDLAYEFTIAVVVVRHCHKGSSNDGSPLIYRGHGSIDFTASVRSELMLVKDSKLDNIRHFGQVKANLTKLGPAISFSMTDSGPALAEFHDKNLEDVICFSDEEEEKASVLEDAIQEINEILMKGPILKLALIEEMQSNGFSKATINRACKNKKFKIKKINFLKGSRGSGKWVLCTIEQYEDIESMKFECLEDLNHKLTNWSVSCEHVQIINLQ